MNEVNLALTPEEFFRDTIAHAAEVQNIKIDEYMPISKVHVR